MSDMKCPFCQQELRNCCAGVIYTCSKPDSCPHEQCYGSKELWQELIRTRKALENAREAVLAFGKRTDIAMCALAKISKQHPDGCNKGWYVGVARKALEQITALEQNEHFADASKKIEQKDK